MNNDDRITPADTPSTEEDDALAPPPPETTEEEAEDLRRKVAEIERKVADGN
ncbi:hypothetical protein [Pseudomonas umsongensis]|jgi:hypothetical protein|uniref:hypothetical protein n=1 Tax=Pseudomonas umsongensis TaxID=198618 RepID=UPI0015BB25B3|nr:hypothetical protein [Pseudomonas umsongensis]MCK8682506.1 hypothetical protein [Pseudomonas umsongensis]